MGSWQLDPYHTQIEFSARHLGMMTVRAILTSPARSIQITIEGELVEQKETADARAASS